MTVALVLVAVLGWSLAIALLIGRSITTADQRQQPGNVVQVAPGRAMVGGELYGGQVEQHAPFRAQINGLHMARDRCPDCRP